MAIVISFANHKGKVGKTTLALSLADALSREKLSVLVVDSDPQAKATSLLYAIEDNHPVPLERLLDRSVSIAEAITFDTRINRVHLIGATLQLSNLERFWKQTIFKTSFLLRDVLMQVKDAYDVIIVDTPPSTGYLSANALSASDFVFVPVDTSTKLSLVAADDMARFIADAQRVNPNLTLGGAILTKHNSSNIMCKIIAGGAKEYFGNVLDASFPPTSDVRKAQGERQTILQYDEDQVASKSVRKIAHEIMEITGLSAKEPVTRD